mmetsp:Transcript_7349/g.17923  ORF Transcript_7349/g.17923 Transcript_7349/m.17923 type:complete len:698 (-) Transcript_7349:753-2846(-)|eukprot:CAMPEP_0197189508 /NCGR_PEP_ID=MMETSP1423-20130617/19853_1 /TAXON_ID=476441 /ORGANISM="Pseudo-nitzschia heimii, Strain UNC1101" /LENGTH=697 /DNA_ID=CAMNT_0042641631 /DNA_START=412 /DNA_END=2505 /DNA_ORIENTATION=-
MTASTEWSQVESTIDSIPPASSDDLFDGDILGDELMDIYNAAVVGGDDDLNEIPSLLGPSDLPTDGVKKEETTDDGFGAFRPSTSFNNLSMIIQEPSNQSNPAGGAPAVQPSTEASANATRVVSSTSLSPNLAISPTSTIAVAPTVTTPGGTKRKLSSETSGTSPKRKNSTGSKTKQSPKGLLNKKLTKKTNPNATALSIKAMNLPNVKTQLVAPITPSTLVPPQILASVQAKEDLKVPIPAASQAQPATSAVAKKKSSVVSTSSASTTAPTSSVLSNPPTEADFKSVAQAAVNNLIMNAGTANKTNSSKSTKGRSNSSTASASNSKAASITTTKRVDTSTEHVKALTGSNWVAVCGGANTSGDSNNNQSNSEKMCNRARRSNLTPDERARQNRDRNREHARNTRLRKKAYVEELKATLSALVSQRDAAELEKRHASQRELEQREVRFRVLEEFLKLRGRNEANAVRWAAILDEKFTLTLPVTKFREMIHSNDSSHRNTNALHEQVLTGVAEVMNDSTLCSSFLQSLGKNGNNEIISLVYNCERHNFFMDNCTAMLDWTATTHGASEQGIELIVKGHTRAKFCPASNKLISAVMSFDTGAIMSQVNLIKKVKESSEAEAAAAAAQVAANEADALLDSLQMPHFEPPSIAGIPEKVNVVSLCSGSSSASSNEEKAVISSDDENHNNSKEEVADAQISF